MTKTTGIIGVSFGFLGKDFLFIGGIFLSAAIFCIFVSIALSLIQTSKDKKTFSAHDEENKKIKEFKRMKEDLEAEINSLQERKKSLENMMIRKGKLS